MPDLLHPVQALLAFSYGAAGAGTVLGLLARAILVKGGTGSGQRRDLSSTEAALCALFPLLTLGFFALFAWLPLSPMPGHLFHHEWHAWMAEVHRVPWLHGVLHAANAALVVFTLLCVGRAAFASVRDRTLQRTLREIAQDSFSWGDSLTVHRVPAGGGGRAYCFTVGALRPRVYVSEGLLEKISARDAEAMLAHEAAHVRRRDGLVKSVLTLFYLVFPIPGGAVLCREWESASERACDAEAARHLGNACDVASALVAAARLMGSSNSLAPPAAASATRFTARSTGEMEGRVQALLFLDCDKMDGLPPHQRLRESPLPVALLGMLGVAMCLLMHPYLAHFVELFVHH